MASEITYSSSLTASKNGASITLSGSHTQDMSGTEMTSAVQTMATSAAQLTIGGVDTIAAISVKNLDSAINVTIGLDSPITQILSVIQPGASVLLTGISTTVYGKSASGTPDIFIAVVEA